jgi:hypothetical protein
MRTWRRAGLAAVVSSAALLGGCRATRGPSDGHEAPNSPATSSTRAEESVDINKIFPPGPGRELVLNNCTSCHTFVPIVILQMTREAWERNSRDHRDRVEGLSDSEFKVLYDYLVTNFNPDTPVPKLPKALLNTWTSY